jgi:DNA polymerase IIIc chi subunit
MAAPGTSSNQQRAPPVLVRMPNTSLIQDLLKQGNKQMKTFSIPNIRIVDDVSKQTQEKRAKLIPKMKELRSAGLFAFIPFGPVAKLVYKQGNEWKTIYPEN